MSLCKAGGLAYVKGKIASMYHLLDVHVICTLSHFHICHLSVFGDAFGDECERSVRRLFGGRVVQYHMAISLVYKRSMPHYCILTCL